MLNFSWSKNVWMPISEVKLLKIAAFLTFFQPEYWCLQPIVTSLLKLNCGRILKRLQNIVIRRGISVLSLSFCLSVRLFNKNFCHSFLSNHGMQKPDFLHIALSYTCSTIGCLVILCSLVMYFIFTKYFLWKQGYHFEH